MKWKQIGDYWVSNPYRIYRNTRGYSLWQYGIKSGILGQEIPSLKLAQDIAEQHKRRTTH